MKFITVRDLRTSPAQVWKSLPQEREIVITNNGRPIALLTPISDATLEETLASVRRARAIQAVKTMQVDAEKRGVSNMTSAEVEQEIQEARKARRRRP